MAELEKSRQSVQRVVPTMGHEEEAVAVLGRKKWPREDRDEVFRLGETFFALPLAKKEGTAGHREPFLWEQCSVSRGRVVNGLTTLACKTRVPPPRGLFSF